MSTLVQYVVAEKKKEISRTSVVVDGDHVAPASDAVDGEPAVTFTLTPALADAVASGALDLSVGFMRGEVKMAGDFGVLLHVLPTLSRAPGL